MFALWGLNLKKIFNLVKKALLIFLIYVVVITLFLHFINRDTSTPNYNSIEKNQQKIYELINNPKLQKSSEGKLTITLYRLILCRTIGEACTNNPADRDKNFNYSLFGLATNLFVLPYVNPPASGIYWAHYSLQNAGFIPKVYAQGGIGFNSLKPLIYLWKIFRDVSYMLLVIILITIGFMIMLRAKINPQTVISLENSIPKIVITLLFITFSFAIAGFLIDLMYLLIGFTISFLEPNGNWKESLVAIINGGANNLFKEIFSLDFIYKGARGLIDVFPLTIKTVINLITTAISIYILNFFLIGKIFNVSKIFGSIPAFGGILGFAVESILLLFISPYVSGIFFTLIMIVTVFFLFFRIFFLLWINYIELLIYILLSPLIIMFEAVPGRSTFSMWFKKIFFNIFVFYLVFVLLNLTKQVAMISSSNNYLWDPPFVNSIEYEYFPAFVALGFLLIIPEIINQFKRSVGIKDFGLSFNLGTFFGGIGGIIGGVQAGMSTYTSFAQMPFIGLLITNLLRKKGGKLGQAIAPETEKEILNQIRDILSKKS